VHSGGGRRPRGPAPTVRRELKTATGRALAEAVRQARSISADEELLAALSALLRGLRP
jgi:hypothetical protein